MSTETPTPTFSLSPVAVDAMHRLELALADRIVANFDSYGSLWGFDTVEDAERSIDWELVSGTAIDEWETIDRDGRPLRVVRIADPTFLDTICVFSAWGTGSKAVA
ncbi:hypothetical protein ACIG0D_27365 [Streptomyces sp. NPDC052773]|uniref:hypothetical protein n=1 Tax=Streptomyces sp. NPDC052773 TaxID=3365693 RepID=UPI0037D7FB02